MATELNLVGTKLVGGVGGYDVDPAMDGSPPRDFALLPDPPNGNVDTASAIAMLMVESNFARRKSAQEARGKARVEMAEAQKEEVKEMRSAADARYTSAVVGAWVQIGTGAVTLGSMAASPACESWGESMRNAPLKAAGSTVFTAMDKGGKDLAKGVGQLATAGLDHDASDADANAKAAGYTADYAKSIAEELRDDETAAMQSIDRTIDFLKEYETSASQARLAALYKF